MALHGAAAMAAISCGAGFATARSFGSILVAPTATGPTWALMGDDADTPNLKRILRDCEAAGISIPNVCC